MKFTASFPPTVSAGAAPATWRHRSRKRICGSYIRLLDRHGIAFNYLLNGACFGNREWTRPWQKRVTALLARLGEMGVRRVTVSTPFLLELVKRRFPEFKVRVGIYAQVDTPRRARFWEELGADAITLESFSINRNFPPSGGDPPGGPLRSATDREPRLPHELSDANLSSERFRPCV
jgi:hypothetical protein